MAWTHPSWGVAIARPPLPEGSGPYTLYPILYIKRFSTKKLHDAIYHTLKLVCTGK